MYTVLINLKKRASFHFLDEAIYWLETIHEGNGLIVDEEDLEVYPLDRNRPTFIPKWNEKIHFDELRKSYHFYKEVKQIYETTSVEKINELDERKKELLKLFIEVQGNIVSLTHKIGISHSDISRLLSAAKEELKR